MFSVVIPLYNKERYIASTLNSVLNQSFKDFEVIIVNDGSTDRSVEVVKKFDDSRIRLVDQPNAGVSAARNKGIKEAKFDWVAFLDADDRWDNNFLDEIAKAVEAFPAESIFVGGQRVFYPDKSDRYNNPYLPDQGKTALINYYQVTSEYNPPIHSSNVVIKKRMFDQYGFFREGQKNFEDHNLWMRLCVECNVVYINKELSLHWKDDPNSASKGSFRAQDFATMITTFIEVENKLSVENKIYFKKYYNRFITLSLIKNSVNYTADELIKIKREYKKLCKPHQIYLNHIIVFINSPFLYLLLRPFKKIFIKNAV